MFVNLRNNFQISLMHHAGTDKAEVHFLGAFIVRNGPNGIMGVSLGNIFIVYIRIGNHRFVDLIEIDHEFLKIFGIGIRGKGGLFSGFNFSDSLVRDIDQSLKYLTFIIPCPCRSSPEFSSSQFPGIQSGYRLGKYRWMLLPSSLRSNR